MKIVCNKRQEEITEIEAFMNIEKIYKNRILYIDKELRVEYKSGKLSFKKNYDDSVLKIVDLSNSVKDTVLSTIPATERMFRYEPRYLDRVGSNTFLLSNRGKLSLINIDSGKQKTMYKYATGTKNPLYFCSYKRNGIREIVFGDYGGHDAEGNVGIYRYSGKTISQVASVDGKKVDHIHRVEYDQYRDCYWVLTGDSDEGSGIWNLKYDSQTPEAFLLGSQQYRACVAFITDNSMLYATDSPVEKNHIYKLDLNSKEVSLLSDLPGPCIYGIERKNAEKRMYYFATAVEPDSTLSSMHYHITYRLGAGINDRYTHIISGNEEKGFVEVFRSKKDWMPMWLFQFGNVRFPTQDIHEVTYYCPQSCKDKGTYRINI